MSDKRRTLGLSEAVGITSQSVSADSLLNEADIQEPVRLNNEVWGTSKINITKAEKLGSRTAAH